jgi:hypothetical protein
MAPAERGSTGPEATSSDQEAARALSRRRRDLWALATLAALAFVLGATVGGGSGSAEPEQAESAAAPAEPQELPRGGRTLFPDYRVVALYGAPQDEELGALGIGSPAEAAERLREQARGYRSPERRVLPAFELIATIASASADADERYSFRQPDGVIRRYLREARRRDALLILDIQPGRAGFMDEVRALRRYLREPDVGLALDPEWRVGPDEIPGQTIGSVDGNMVNRVAEYLAELVSRHDLPEKLLVVHQFTPEMITRRDAMEEREGVAIVLNSDGFGDRANKIAKYEELRPPRRSPFHRGFKLFYGEDTELMAPEEVLALEPAPDLVVYE